MGELTTNLCGFFFELLDGSFVDSAAFVDQVTSGGGLPGVDVANDHDVDVDFLPGHFELLAEKERSLLGINLRDILLNEANPTFVYRCFCQFGSSFPSRGHTFVNHVSASMLRRRRRHIVT